MTRRRNRITISSYIIGADGQKYYRENPNTRALRRLLIAGAMPFLAILLIGSTIGIYKGITGSHHTAPASDTVKDFNDGFSDSKKDDCDQGFAPACAWLASTRG